MPTLAWIIVFCLLGGVLSVLAASTMMLFNTKIRTRLIPHLVSFAIGALLGAAFLVILPHSIGNGGGDHAHNLDIHSLTLTLLLGILGFFLLEKMVLWRHCHSDHCAAHSPQEQLKNGKEKSKVTLILVGDSMHNFVDGIAIAVAFSQSFHLGVITSLAIIVHEIPQELGDFAILLDNGLSRLKALLFNLLSTLATVFGGLLAYYFLSGADELKPYILTVAAASFIYIAVADLIPGLHERAQFKDTLKQIVLIALGVGIIYFSHELAHNVVPSV